MPAVNSGDTAWMLASSALVLFMTPGLALFYGGMGRSKNVLSTIMYSVICMGVVTLLWGLVGYTMAFGSDIGGVIGGLDFVGMQHVYGTVSHWAPTRSAAGVRRLPVHVRDHRPGADHRRVRRAHEVRRVGCAHERVVAARVRARSRTGCGVAVGCSIWA